MAAKLIAYECVAAGHRPSAAHPDKLTIHRGSWAFCAFDARADGHQWKDTGGEQYEVLLRRIGFAVAETEPSQRV